MKKIILLLIFLISSAFLFAQIKSDSIIVKKDLGTSYIWKGVKLSPRALVEMTRDIPEAHKEMGMAKTNYDFATAFGFIGGLLIGWPIGTAIAGGEPEWGLAAIGAGFVVFSIPFSSAYNTHAKKAVEIYNSSLQHTGLHKIQFDLSFSCNGMGVKMVF